MKKSAWIIAMIALTISACTSQKQATSYVNDDVYNSSRDEQVKVAPAATASQGAQVITSPDKAAVKKPASSTFESDYNDYSYSDRINRFSNKDTTVGYFAESNSGGYSTGSQGSDPNVNIYLGSGGGYGGYYNPSFSYGMGWGYPYSSWGWDYGWGYPYYGGYYGWGYPYYYGGYSPWYYPYYNNCCYCYGYNEYYQSYSTPGNYYGSRQSLYRTDLGTGTPNSRNTVMPESNLSSRNTRGSITPSPRVTPDPTVRSRPANQEKYRYSRPSNDRQAGYQRNTQERSGQAQNQNSRQQPAPRYTRPENATPAQRSGDAQSYSPPVYRQPKSSQEYLAPRAQNPGSTRTAGQNTGSRESSGSYNTGTRQNATPTNYNRTNSTPVRSGSSGYSTPVRTNTNYTAPTRSGNTQSTSEPSRSGNSRSYSPPSNSNSGGSYSTPSRSGGGGNSGSSSGGSSSGGGGRHR